MANETTKRDEIARMLHLPMADGSFCVDCPVNDRVLTHLAGINFFVGTNNSGKSRLLRALALGKGFPIGIPNSPGLHDLERIQHEIRRKLALDIDNRQTTQAELRSLAYILPSPLDKTSELAQRPSGSRSTVIDKWREGYYDRSHNIRRHGNQALSAIESTITTDSRPLRIYIPALRSLRSFISAKESRGAHSEREESALFHSCFNSYCNELENSWKPIPGTYDNGRVSLFTGEDLFSLITEYKLGDLKHRKMLTTFEEFLGRQFFDGQEVALIPKLRSGLLDIKIGSQPNRPIDHLGDGIQQLIILTIPLFLFTSNYVVVCVEEPEIFLHPGQQRSLLEAWHNDRPAGMQIFATTHSQQFLDMTIDSEKASVYRFSRNGILSTTEEGEENPVFRVSRWSPDDRSLLKEMGITSSSVLLVNATIWVEGITDRLYLRKYIDLIQNSDPASMRIREDVHYSFVEYGGAAIVHWSFLHELAKDHTINVSKLCGDAFLICDRSKKERQSDRERHQLLMDTMHDRYYRLEVLEIENLLSPRVLEATLKQSGIDVKISNHKGYKLRRIGEFVQTQSSGTSNTSLFDKNGVIIDKARFCRIALENISSVEDLTDEAKTLAHKIIEFVRQMNSLTAPIGHK